MAQVVWTKKASGQFERAIKYIFKEQGFHYANIVREKILQKTALLEDQPRMGTIEPLLAHKKYEYRFLLVWSYKIIYRTTKDKAIISRVFHTSRSPKKIKRHLVQPSVANILYTAYQFCMRHTSVRHPSQSSMYPLSTR